MLGKRKGKEMLGKEMKPERERKIGKTRKKGGRKCKERGKETKC